MKKLKQLRKLGAPKPSTVFNQPGRPKIHIATIAAVFQQFNERRQQINLLYNDPWSEEALMAAKRNLDHLRKRLEDFGLDSRFDFNSYTSGKYNAPILNTRKKRQ